LLACSLLENNVLGLFELLLCVPIRRGLLGSIETGLTTHTHLSHQPTHVRVPIHVHFLSCLMNARGGLEDGLRDVHVLLLFLQGLLVLTNVELQVLRVPSFFLTTVI
jgi:hypothetical protein